MNRSTTSKKSLWTEKGGDRGERGIDGEGRRGEFCKRQRERGKGKGKMEIAKVVQEQTVNPTDSAENLN